MTPSTEVVAAFDAGWAARHRRDAESSPEPGVWDPRAEQRAEDVARFVADTVEEKHAFDNGSGMTEVMTAPQMVAEIQRLGKRCEELHAQCWPNVIAPPKYANPAPGWTDPSLPDFALIWKMAREVGYAVGIHGSLKRDVDLIAAPWTPEAVGNAELVDHLCAGLNATRVGGPEHKPHGRVAVTLQIDGWFKPIDLSIMPRLRDMPTVLDAEARRAQLAEVAAEDAYFATMNPKPEL